ncbi:MAG: hypothetical protein A2X86_02720 [Bdellovibrionales bacterium GWA2_49_15]|nr:MAG: hypothetical protein A2X86_02720 [Bdellovibrionales bacterium GWA2_49_15]HAZ14148.1 hypothetical protein [Bdellovibrionales bacterium]
MTAKAKERIQGALKNIEKNFQQLLNNEDVKKVLTDMKKLKSKRTKQIDKMLNDSWDDIKQGYTNEARGLEKLFAKEKKKVNKVFQEQLTELKKIKKAVEDHIASARGQKVRKVAKAKGTRKTAAPRKKTAAKRTRSTVKASPVVINQPAN